MSSVQVKEPYSNLYDYLSAFILQKHCSGEDLNKSRCFLSDPVSTCYVNVNMIF